MTIAIAGVIAIALHRMLRRSRLRSWLDLDDDPDDRIGRLGDPVPASGSPATIGDARDPASDE